MSTQDITDYLTKQLFIEKNIVTYRSLSRQFSLHVNTAKNELATYHHNAPYQSQNCCATFVISGPIRKDRSIKGSQYEEVEDESMDVDMNPTPGSSMQRYTADEEGEGDEESDSEEVEEIQMTLVNENDLDSAKEKYDDVHSVHVYSLAPASLIDAGLICDRTEFVRATDRSKGPEWPSVVGQVVGASIKMGPSRKGKRPAIPPPQPAAGPSKTKPTAQVQEPSKASTSASTTAKSEPTVEKPKEKPKGAGKLNFFSKPKDAAGKSAEEPKKVVKKEESAQDTKKMMFFSKPAEKPKTASPAPPAPVAKSGEPEKIKFGPPRGVKRKSSIGLEGSRERTPDNPAVAKGAKTTGGARLKGRILLSDDESDDAAPVKSKVVRKSRTSFKSDSSGGAMDSEAEKEGRALMDLDDDLVETVSHAPSTVVSEFEDGGSELDGASIVEVKMEADDDDVDMADETVTKPVPKKRKAKTVIPVGKNGLKKRKVTKTRRRKDEKGFLHAEDYTDWESVEEEEAKPAQEPKAKSKPKAVAPKKEDTDTETKPAAKEKKKAETEKEKESIKKAPAQSKPSASSKAKPKLTGNVKTKQGGLMNFFGATKKT